MLIFHIWYPYSTLKLFLLTSGLTPTTTTKIKQRGEYRISEIMAEV
jgi:hypothetical protein